MQLNGKTIRALTPREKPYKVTGGRSLIFMSRRKARACGASITSRMASACP